MKFKTWHLIALTAVLAFVLFARSETGQFILGLSPLGRFLYTGPLAGLFGVKRKPQASPPGATVIG